MRRMLGRIASSMLPILLGRLLGSGVTAAWVVRIRWIVAREARPGGDDSRAGRWCRFRCHGLPRPAVCAGMTPVRPFTGQCVCVGGPTAMVRTCLIRSWLAAAGRCTPLASRSVPSGWASRRGSRTCTPITGATPTPTGGRPPEKSRSPRPMAIGFADGAITALPDRMN